LTVISAGPAEDGQMHGAIVPGDVAGTVLYTPDVDFAGTANFLYTVRDARGDSSTAQVTVQVVRPPNGRVRVVAATGRNVMGHPKGKYASFIQSDGVPFLATYREGGATRHALVDLNGKVLLQTGDSAP